MIGIKVSMHLPPSKTKLLLGRMNKWKLKANDKSYQLREAKKESKRLKGSVSDIKDAKNKMRMDFLKKITTLQATLVKTQQADDEKIKKLELRIQQLEFEAKRADGFKKNAI
jgi:hypothetical protein